MKKQIILCFLLIGVGFSCTKDEEPKILEEIDNRTVLESIQRTYNTDSGDLEAIYKSKFQNNRLLKFEYFNANEELTYYQNLDSNDDGLLTKIAGYSVDGTLDYESKLFYDDLKRLIKEETSEENGSYITTVTIEYNTDNTITRLQDSNGSIQTKFYYLNDDGIIYKVERNGSVIEEAVYDENNNVLSMNDGNTTYSYYDATIEKKGISKRNLIGGDNANNAVLYGEYLRDQASVYGINHVKEITYSSSNTTFEREFDEDNYPLKWSTYYSGKLYSVTELVYE